jgi:hypothetical protein
VPERWPGVALTAVSAGLGAVALPFYPSGWWLGIAAIAGAAAAVRPRLGLAIALAAPLLPFGNLSLALAVVYGAIAAGWLLLFLREPHGGALPALGPLLGPVGALVLAPVAVLRLRSPLRRALATAAIVLLATVAAALRRSPLPLTGDAPPLGLGLAGSEAPGAVASTLAGALAAQPGIVGAGIALAAAAVLLPYARTPWAVCGLGAGLLAALLLAVPGLAVLPVVVPVWAICTAVTLRPRS